MRFRGCFGLLFLAALPVRAAESLLFLETQMVGGYSFGRHRAIYYSQSQDEAMQKPSVGFDWLQRLSTPVGDWGRVAVQGRLAWNKEGGNHFEGQLYNAYAARKIQETEIWAGHNRPAMGLASAWDTHGTMLQPLTMYGFGFDRDWGVGAGRLFPWGDVRASLTTGSGMPLYFKGNWLASARASAGALERDNYSAGLSVARGRTLDTMGLHLMESTPETYGTVGADGTVLWDRFTQRLEAITGRRQGQNVQVLFSRTGVGFLEESRLTVEAQPVAVWTGGRETLQWGAGASYVLNQNWTARVMSLWDRRPYNAQVVAQLYGYFKI